ncbi:MAG: (Fe-S)-binding protein [Moorellales bacterium]
MESAKAVPNPCLGCGLCRGSCPLSDLWWPQGEVSTPRGKVAMLEEILAGRLEPDETFEAEFWYRCTLCARCELDCPALVPVTELVVRARRYLVERGKVPVGAAASLRRLRLHRNPWGRPAAERQKMAGSFFPSSVRSSDTLLFLGCLAGYDRRAGQAASALVRILADWGVDFAVLPDDEPCCGGEAYAMGEEGLYEQLVQANLEIFSRRGVRRIITYCPHCYHAFKTLYPPELEVYHYTEVLEKLLDGGAVPPRDGPALRVWYHDPCHLGRRQGIYEPPRRILEALPGVIRVTTATEARKGLCCEAGGGRMWYGPPGSPPSLARRIVEQAREAGADAIAVACPFCLTALEPWAGQAGMAIWDLAEIVQFYRERGGRQRI